MKKRLFTAILTVAASASLCACAALEGMPDKPQPYETATESAETIIEGTAITGKAQITEKAAKKWAKSHNAADEFIDAAKYYWKCGEEYGIRPEVLYAQAAKETDYGHFGNRVTADMNNFAGIKKADAVGDEKDDHESFPSPADGVRAHFNHICAYIGINPIGEVHPRYSVVMRSQWAGTIKNVEDLGGKWCPDPDYGNSIKRDFLDDMVNF